MLRKLGECELAWLAADRSMAVAQRADDPLLAGIATTRVCNALVAMGRARPALELNVNIANRLAPGGGNDASPDRLSVYGMLLLQGAMAAARIGDSATVDDLLNGAQEAATLLGGDQNHYWTSFGPTNLELHRAAAAVELGDGGRAVEMHQRASPSRRSTRCCPSAARTTCSTSPGATPSSATWRTPARCCCAATGSRPSEIRCRPIAHEVMSDVLRRTRGAPPPPIAELAEHMGVGV